jgi:isoquinoline 1-oxidoreductase subunit alpha
MGFVLNGVAVDVPPERLQDRLLWVLRDHFGLNGPKYGCGVGLCGACVVHVDGAAVRSCALTAEAVAGRTVVTLEGLGAGRPDGIHPVQAAWIAASVPQCGYCQNGQIMTAAALLARSSGVSAAELATAMDEVICRCGTQARIKVAIERAKRTIAGGGR